MKGNRGSPLRPYRATSPAVGGTGRDGELLAGIVPVAVLLRPSGPGCTGGLPKVGLSFCQTPNLGVSGGRKPTLPPGAVGVTTPLLIWMDPSIDYFRELFRLIVFCVRRVKTMSDFEMNATADQPDMRGLVTA